MKNRHTPNNKILFITLGCSKNTVDSERLMRQLSLNSLDVEYENYNSDARTVIINTCGFILDAKKESIDVILSYAEAKRQGKIDHLLVMGCLSERYTSDLQKEIPEVDKFFGVNAIAPILEYLGCNYQKQLINERLITTPSHYAYLKISEGCNRSCAFCSIPSIRGNYQSFPIPDLLNEARFLASNGVKELILVAQDTSVYGNDLYKKNMLVELINQLSEIDGIEWIRIHYLYPTDFSNDLLKVINNNPKVCKYLDIPIQHISDNMLLAMKRGHTKSQLINLIDKIRNSIPEIVLRTTLMVGFPGESEEDYMELLNFVEKVRFDRLGVFTYSHEEGTYAGLHYDDHVSKGIKNRRASRLMSLQQEISLENNKARIGKTIKILIDREEKEYFIGRTEYDSPEVDNEIFLTRDDRIRVGQFYPVLITDADAFDLWGQMV
jgi:ribosomal protein S12 methylthiotransferase